MKFSPQQIIDRRRWPMTRRCPGWQLFGFATALTLLAAGCGGSDPAASTPTPPATNTQASAPTFTGTNALGATVSATVTPQVTPTQAVASVKGFLVVNRGVNASSGDGLGAPPAAWVGKGDPSSF